MKFLRIFRLVVPGSSLWCQESGSSLWCQAAPCGARQLPVVPGSTLQCQAALCGVPQLPLVPGSSLQSQAAPCSARPPPMGPDSSHCPPYGIHISTVLTCEILPLSAYLSVQCTIVLTSSPLPLTASAPAYDASHFNCLASSNPSMNCPAYT